MKKDNDKKRKINLSFDNLAIPEVHLHRTHKDNANADTNSETVEKSVDSQSFEGNKSTDSKKEKPSISFDSVAIPEIHIKKK